MRITLVDVPFASALAARLAGRHDVDTFHGDVCTDDLAQLSGADLVIFAPARHEKTTDRLLQATLGVWRILTEAAPRRFVLLSSMRLFDGLDPRWAIDESWYPRPAATDDHLGWYLAELTARELSRTGRVRTEVLRLDTVTADERWRSGPIEPEWLHLDDAVEAIATTCEAESPEALWTVRHVVRGSGRYRLSARDGADHPKHPGPDQATRGVPSWPVEPGPLTDLAVPRRVTIYGAAGPLGTATGRVMRDDHLLHLTDAITLTEAGTRPPQSPGAPVAAPLGSPHTEAVVDITDAEQVADAARDADCLVNVSVVRTQVEAAFRVNLLGALHVARAAVALGIPRIVFTGPTLAIGDFPYGFLEDPAVAATAPSHPGDRLYLLTKMLGQEATRVIAEEHGLAAPVLLFCGLRPPVVEPGGRHQHPFTVTWHDAGLAVRAAARVEGLSQPVPVLNVLSPSPHGHYRHDEITAELGWRPTESLAPGWYRP